MLIAQIYFLKQQLKKISTDILFLSSLGSFESGIVLRDIYQVSGWATSAEECKK